MSSLWDLFAKHPITSTPSEPGNILHLQPGVLIVSHDPAEKDRTWTVTAVRAYCRSILGERFYFTDYQLLDGDDVRMLRANPKDGSVDLLWLRVAFELEFDQTIVDAAKQEHFIVTNDQGQKTTYDALSAGKDGFRATVHHTTKGKPENDHDTVITYWDFSRSGQAERGEVPGQPVYFFVEVDATTGFITMLEGQKITPTEYHAYASADEKLKAAGTLGALGLFGRF